MRNTVLVPEFLISQRELCSDGQTAGDSTGVQHGKRVCRMRTTGGQLVSLLGQEQIDHLYTLISSSGHGSFTTEVEQK